MDKQNFHDVMGVILAKQKEMQELRSYCYNVQGSDFLDYFSKNLSDSIEEILKGSDFPATELTFHFGYPFNDGDIVEFQIAMDEEYDGIYLDWKIQETLTNLFWAYPEWIFEGFMFSSGYDCLVWDRASRKFKLDTQEHFNY